MVKNTNYKKLIELENTGRKLDRQKGKKGLDWEKTGYNNDMIEANNKVAIDARIDMRRKEKIESDEAGEECADLIFTGNRKSFVFSVPWK